MLIKSLYQIAVILDLLFTYVVIAVIYRHTTSPLRDEARIQRVIPLKSDEIVLIVGRPKSSAMWSSLILRTIENIKNLQYKNFMQL